MRLALYIHEFSKCLLKDLGKLLPKHMKKDCFQLIECWKTRVWKW